MSPRGWPLSHQLCETGALEKPLKRGTDPSGALEGFPSWLGKVDEVLRQRAASCQNNSLVYVLSLWTDAFFCKLPPPP